MATPQEEIARQVEQDHQELKNLIAAFLLVGGTYLTVQEWADARKAQKPRLMKRVNKLLADQNQRLVNNGSIEKLVDEVWNEGATQAQKELRQAGEQVTDTLSKREAETVKDALAKELKTDLTKLRVGMLRSTDKVVTDLIDDAVLKASRGTPLGDAIGEAVKQFDERGVPGIIDRSGRRWKPETFTDLCVRVTQQRTRTQVKVAVCRHSTTRYVKVVGGGANTCRDCAALEGKILSVTAPALPPAVMTVDQAIQERLFHPRCTHDIAPWKPV